MVAKFYTILLPIQCWYSDAEETGKDYSLQIWIYFSRDLIMKRVTSTNFGCESFSKGKP